MLLDSNTIYPEDVKALMGRELIFERSDGTLVDIYVAQADINKGISFMGQTHDDNPKESVLWCLHFLPETSIHGRYDLLVEYMEAIGRGYEPYDHVNDKGGSATYMNNACAFS